MFYSLNEAIIIIFKTFEVLIILRILLSWVRFGRGSDFNDFVHDFTEPILKPFRITLNLNPGMGLDLSPIIALFVLYNVELLVLNLTRFL